MDNMAFDEEKFNMDLRKFLKKVGITSQREIEHAVRSHLESGKLSGSEHLKAKMTLELPDVALTFKIDGDIALS